MVPKIAKSMSQVVQTSAQSSPKASSPIPTKSEKSAPATKPQISTEPDSSILQTKSTSHKKELATDKPKNRFIPRVITGVLGVSGIGAGVYFNSVAESESKKSKDFYALYKSEEGSPLGLTCLDKSKLADTKANAAATPRLISYIVGGLAAAGFTLTFVF